MKKILYTFLTIATCIFFITGCSFFGKPDDSSKDDSSISSDTEQETTDPGTTEEEGDEIPVDNPQDASSETTDDTEEENTADTTADPSDSSNPRENIANDASKEYSASGKYCGFIDSNSVEIELTDGTYCTFFVFEEEVRNSLSALDEEDMPEISFTYKGRDGQINPEMISVIGG